jgi:signal transduction histidine kinase
MTEVLIFAAGAALGSMVAWMLGVKRGTKEIQDQLDPILSKLRAGKPVVVGEGAPGEAPKVKAIREVLAKDWKPRRLEAEDPVRNALARIAEYLRHRVESPLLAGLEAGGRGLKAGAGDALDAVEDLEFFLEDPPVLREGEVWSLGDVVQEVTRDFAAQSPVLVKVVSPPEAIRVRLDPEPFKDALFLILHNAGEFGGGEPVQVILAREGGQALLRVRDRGPGFSAEALIRAMDPFYSTAPGGLGLGLPHARRAVNAQGGEIFLNNADSGGAEVEVRIPLAG